MYGTMEQSIESKRPLLAKREDMHQTVNNESSFRSSRALKMMDEVAGTRMMRTSGVLASIMEKSRNGHGHIYGTSITRHMSECSDTIELSTQRTPKSFVYTMLNPRSKSVEAVSFKWFITLVIVADLISFAASTEPNLDESHQRIFYIWEGVTSTIFLFEYVTRLVVVTEARKYNEQGPIGGRMSYALTFPALIDFLATFPFFIELVTGLSMPTLTYLRAFRLLRILKTSGFAEATKAVYRVIYYNRQILYVAMLICVGLVLFTAVLMYYLRPKDPKHSQDFQSLARTMYLSTLMLTGQGGPDGDMPWYTKGVVLMTGVFSIGMFAIPASMLTWGFEAEAERMANLAYVQQNKTEQVSQDDNWSFSSDDYSTGMFDALKEKILEHVISTKTHISIDEEYRRIIAGADEAEERDAESQARKAFLLADIDRSGSISLTEYLAMSREQAANLKNSEGLSALTIEDLSNRFRALETRVEENSQTLEKIYQLLNQKKS